LGLTSYFGAALAEAKVVPSTTVATSLFGFQFANRIILFAFFRLFLGRLDLRNGLSGT